MSAHKAAATDDPALDSWQPVAGSADSDLLSELDIMVPRSRDLARNNGLFGGAVQTFKDNIIGAQLRLSALPDYRLLGWDRAKAREWANNTEAQFRSFADTVECDAGQSLTLLGLSLQALGGAMTNGDAVALPLWLPRPGGRWNTRLMVLEADRLCTPTYLQHRTDIRGGVESDSFGAPLAYWFANKHPGDMFDYGAFGASSITWERVPAFTEWGRRRVIHLHDKERSGQSRGKPIVAAVMREFHLAGMYANTELQASVANSLIAAFMESDLGQDSVMALFGEKPRDTWGELVKQPLNVRKSAKGPTVIPLPVGAKLSAFTPGRPNAAFEAFMMATLRHIAAGMNLPYELLLKDFSQSNYSSARAALLEAWRYFNGRRRWLMDTWLRPIYELWLEEAVNAGVVEAPGFYENRYAYTRCRFIFSGRGWVDPTKEAQAALLRMEGGLSTMEAECAEQGLDWEEVLEQQAIEAQRRSELGLPPASSTSVRAFGQPDPVQNDEGDDATRTDEEQQ